MNCFEQPSQYKGNVNVIIEDNYTTYGYTGRTITFVTACSNIFEFCLLEIIYYTMIHLSINVALTFERRAIIYINKCK